MIALDEPTNHLDVEGIAWLAEHVKNRWAKNSGALLVVTRIAGFSMRFAPSVGSA